MSGTNGQPYPLSIIPDGYTRSGYFAGVPNLYGPVRFKYRPMLAAERAAVIRAVGQASDPRKEEHLAAQTIKARLASWDISNDKGEPAEITIENVLHLQPRLSARFFRAIIGDEGGDDDPTPDAATTAQNEADFQAALAGKTPEQVEADAAKN